MNKEIEKYEITKVTWVHRFGTEYVELRNGELDKVSLLEKLGERNLSSHYKREYLKHLLDVITNILALEKIERITE